MSFKTKLFTGITASFAAAAFATFASAQDTPAPDKPDAPRAERADRKGGRHGEFGMRGEKHGMPGLMGIELTDAQKEQLRQIHEANRPDPAVRQEMMSLMKAKHEGTLTADQEARFKTLRDEGRAKGDQIHQQILGILTPEQRQQIETRKREMRKKMQERRQNWQQKSAAPSSDTPKSN